jgi:hypothetical protein
MKSFTMGGNLYIHKICTMNLENVDEMVCKKDERLRKKDEIT